MFSVVNSNEKLKSCKLPKLAVVFVSPSKSFDILGVEGLNQMFVHIDLTTTEAELTGAMLKISISQKVKSWVNSVNFSNSFWQLDR